MTTSGTVSFNLVANEIIDEAFDLCGIGSEGEPISADQYARAKRSLNLVCKAWDANDHLWVRTSMSVSLVTGQAAYTLSPQPMRIFDCRRKVTTSGIETPMLEWSRSQYDEQPNKAVQSIPTSFYYDPQRDTGTLYVWPTASASTSGAMTVELTYLRRIQDIVSSNDSADLPQEWLLALSYALAEQLALKYGCAPDIRSEIAKRAALYKAEINAFDTEPASLFVQPDYRR